MSLSIPCPQCGKIWQVPDQYAGKKVKCPEPPKGCGQPFVVPSVGVSVAASPPASAAGVSPPASGEAAAPQTNQATSLPPTKQDKEAASVAVRQWKTGRVKFFDMQDGFGYVLPDEGGRDVYVSRKDIKPVSKCGLPGLFSGQFVEYQAQGSGTAVRAREKRFGGTVVFFSESNRTCRICSDDQSQTFDIEYADIQPPDRSWKRLWIGEPVEFGIDERGSAVNVLQLDQRPSLFRFTERRSVTFGKLQHLSRIAEQNEEWDYRENPVGELPILRFYIEKTFEQLLAQNRVLYDEDNPSQRSHACFNTGLVNDLQEEILGVFDKNQEYDGSPLTPEWRLDGFYTSNDRRLASFSQTEFPLATYFTKVSELYLDPNETRITLLWPHLMRRLERFPEGLQSVDAARGALERAFRDAMRRLVRNYKTVVPQFYEGEIQLLLPVALADPRVVDRALVLRRQGKTFEATTIFYLDWAYESARIVAKPDKEWLHPVRVKRKDDQDEGEGHFKASVDDEAVRQTQIVEERTEEGEAEVARGPEIDRVKVGSVHLAPVTRIEAFGVFAQIAPGVQLLCHISEYENRHIRDLNDEVKIGQVIFVEVIERMDRGTRKLALSRKAVIKAKGLTGVLEAEGRAEGRPG